MHRLSAHELKGLDGGWIFQGMTISLAAMGGYFNQNALIGHLGNMSATSALWCLNSGSPAWKHALIATSMASVLGGAWSSNQDPSSSCA